MVFSWIKNMCIYLYIIHLFTFSLFKKDFIGLFLERGEGRENERERNINVWLPLLHPQLGTQPAPQACALTGNQTSDPYAWQVGAQSTEPQQPGLFSFIFKGTYFFSCFPFSYINSSKHRLSSFSLITPPQYQAQ